MDKVILKEKFDKITSYWEPGIIGALNGQHVKIAKIKGEFIWHVHEQEDELFYVMKGHLFIRLKNDEIELQEGEMYIVPKGIEHQPYAPVETHIMMFEPAGTLNTGNIKNERTVSKPKLI